MSFNTGWFKEYLSKGDLLPFKTVEDSRSASRNTCPGTEEHYLALSKWCGLSLLEAEAARTAEEAKMAYINAPKKSVAERLAREKWDDYAAVEARNATTPEEARQAYRVSRDDSRASMLALSRWDELLLPLAQSAKTIEEHKAVHAAAGDFMGLGRLESARVNAVRWNDLSMSLLKKAKNKEQAVKVHKNAPYRSPAWIESVEKSQQLPVGKGKDTWLSISRDDEKEPLDIFR